MNEATEESSPLVSIDSSRLSISTIGRSNNNAQELEDLKRELREARSENLELKRAIPNLKDANGEDCTEWAIRITNELEDKKEKYAESQNKLAKLTHQYREFKENMERVARKNERIIEEFKEKAESLEEENRKLRDQLRDEESMNFHLQHGEFPANDERHSTEHFQAALRHIDQQSENDAQSGRSTARTQENSFHSGSRHDQALEGITIALFDKLRSTADFFTELMNSVSEGAEHLQDHQLIEKIKSLKLDLNRSIEMCNKRMEEFRRSAPSSVENSFHLEERQGIANQNCPKCKLVENERDTLKTQLNREIALKEEYLNTNDELERNLRELRRRMEEMRSELQQSQVKAQEIELKLQRTEDYYKNKYSGKHSGEVADLNEKIRVLRKRILESDANNENILRAMRTLKETSQKEINDKDIEVQKHFAEVEQQERRYRQLLKRCQESEKANMEMKETLKSGKISHSALEEELKKRDAQIRKYNKKIDNLRHILASYVHYFDKSIEYENLVERCTEVLEGKINEAISNNL